MQPSEKFSYDIYRELLRRYPTGVTIVTAEHNRIDYGATINSFTTISMNPPLIAVFIVTASRTLSAILKSGKFVVNLLSDIQEEAARNFAADGNVDKFLNSETLRTETNIPFLKDSIGRIECELYLNQEIADHQMVVGKVTSCDVHNQSASMIYYRRKFGATQEESFND